MRPEIKFWDKMLPDQPEHAHLYHGQAFMRDLFETVCRSSGIRNPRDEFKIEQGDMFTVEEMASNPIAMRFLQFLIRIAGVRSVLEIGAFVGLSTMCFAKALPAGGKVVSIEKFDKFAAIARRNFEINGLADKIELFQGDAFEVIDQLPRTEMFDLVFIDGNKERYMDYAVKTEPLLAPRGIMVVDDCFYHGDVLNAVPTDAKGVGTKAFMDYAAASDGWLRIALPLSNGMFLMTRNNS
jgi:predicted O-methyltransferase YrrM